MTHTEHSSVSDTSGNHHHHYDGPYCCPCAPYRFARSIRPCEINTIYPFLNFGTPLYPYSYPLYSPFLLPLATPYLGPVACGCAPRRNYRRNPTSPWC
jgi:hypothetical protein